MSIKPRPWKSASRPRSLAVQVKMRFTSVGSASNLGRDHQIVKVLTFTEVAVIKLFSHATSKRSRNDTATAAVRGNH